jgi:hypothetical protein
MSFNPDMSHNAVTNRYKIANEMAIVTSSRVVFKSLQDIPDLLDIIKELKAKIVELETPAGE